MLCAWCFLAVCIGMLANYTGEVQDGTFWLSLIRHFGDDAAGGYCAKLV